MSDPVYGQVYRSRNGCFIMLLAAAAASQTFCVILLDWPVPDRYAQISALALRSYWARVA